VTDTDFTTPSGNNLALTSTASESYNNVPGGSIHTFTSYVNPSNTPGATEIGGSTLQTFTMSGTNSNNGTMVLWSDDGFRSRPLG
jgi:hypothetical protein